MRFAMTSMIQNKLTTTLGAVLFASFVTATSAWAGEASLAHNERAAQNHIVEIAQSRPVAHDDSVAKLAHNEVAAQRVFVDSTASNLARAGVAMGEAALSHNEIAAQHAIANAPASRTVAIERISASLGAASGSPAAAR
jgi:hypothetical protein